MKKKKQKMSLDELKTEMNRDCFLLKYEYAIRQVEKVLRGITERQERAGEHRSITFITSRIKTAESTAEKLKRKGKPVTIKAAEKHLNDLAGVCVVCCYQEDVYSVARELETWEKLTIIKRKDFIRKPKTTGYRSLHLIAAMTTGLGGEGDRVRVEIQIRTVAMDAWARLDHELRYKKGLRDVDHIYHDLQKCADTVASVDNEMHRIREKIRNAQTC